MFIATIFLLILLPLLLPVHNGKIQKKNTSFSSCCIWINGHFNFWEHLGSAEKNLPGIVSQRQAAFLRLKAIRGTNWIGYSLLLEVI